MAALRPDPVGASPPWDGLQGVLGGEVVVPGSAAYDLGRRPFNGRYDDRRPQALVRCASPEDVAETLAFTTRHGLPIALRSGGHCFAGHSSTSGVVVDVSPMAGVSVSGGQATVGAGARLGDVYDALAAHDRTIPGGTCPTVGIAGLTLGGGLGVLGRTYGVTSDRLVGAQVVLADGRAVDCDAEQEADLFWALRGAGAGNFGVVTSLTFRPVPAPQETTNLHATWPHARAAAVIEAWQRWAPSGPDKLAASLKVTVTGGVDQPPSVDLYATVLGPESEALRLLDQLVVRVGSDPGALSRERGSYRELRRFWANLGGAEAGERPVAHPPPNRLYSKSEFFGRPLPPEATAALVRALSAGRAPGESRELDFMPWAGAYGRVRPQATAFVHRDELFQLKHSVVIPSEASHQARAAARRRVAELWATVHPWGSGRVFPNFADPDLDGWAGAYYGPNLDRLLRVKARYDPANRFRFPQSIPLR
jgi:FAD/FMN-containing dehydrogenase